MTGPQVPGVRLVVRSYSLDQRTDRELRRRARARRLSVSAYLRELGAQLIEERESRAAAAPAEEYAR